MKALLLGCVVVCVLGPSVALASTDTTDLRLSDESAKRAASLLHGDVLETSLSSTNPALQLTDDLRFQMRDVPPLDQGRALSSDTRQILALILGFIPGFGLGHLVARDRDGFVLFL